MIVTACELRHGSKRKRHSSLSRARITGTPRITIRLDDAYMGLTRGDVQGRSRDGRCNTPTCYGAITLDGACKGLCCRNLLHGTQRKRRRRLSVIIRAPAGYGIVRFHGACMRNACADLPDGTEEARDDRLARGGLAPARNRVVVTNRARVISL